MFEKVNPSHPDKVADRIAGAIVDLCYTKSKNPKVACEVLIGHSLATVIIETSEDIANHEVETIVRRIAGNVSIQIIVDQQDPHLAANQQGAVRCGDNGIFKGVPPTHEQKLLTAIAASIYAVWPYDGKYLIADTQHPKECGCWAADKKDLIICQSNADTRCINDVIETFCEENRGKDWRPTVLHKIINPLGYWTGGPDVDCGATNRKLGSDMGDGVTGGGLHGKDLSKADVSVNIWCYLESIRTGHQVTACCSIGDETVNGIPYADIVEQARLYIHTLGGFEKFAEWGLIRPDRAQ
jgi:S-adenosylmethionine synthetase